MSPVQTYTPNQDLVLLSVFNSSTFYSFCVSNIVNAIHDTRWILDDKNLNLKEVTHEKKDNVPVLVLTSLRSTCGAPFVVLKVLPVEFSCRL